MWKQSEYRRVIAEVVITNVFGCVHFNSKWIVYLSQRYREMTSFLPIQFFLLSNIRCPAVSNTNKIYCSLFFLCSGRIVTGVPFRMKANFIRRKIMKNNFSLEIGLCLVFVALFIRSLSLYLFVVSIEKWAHWKWAHAMLNQHVFDFSVMIFVIIWNSVNSK